LTFGVRRKIERYYENMQRDEVEEKLRGKPLVEEDIIGFCEKRLGFKPTAYQEKLFRDQNQFIVGIWSRQSGKSQALAVLALYQALAKPKARIVVLAPSLRQSRKIVQRVGSFLSQLPDDIVNGKILQTRLKFVNGSSIEALPNNAPTARGETLDMLICLPGSARILTLGGASVRIDKLSPGETVLSYNTFTHLLESKRILRVFKNNLADRSMVRVRHENGSIDCTFEHKIYTTNRGYVPAGLLTLSDQLVTTQKRGLETTILDPVQISPRATDTRRTPRRLLSHEGQRTPKKRVLGMPAFLQASRVRSIQIFHAKGIRPKPSKTAEESGIRQMERQISDTCASDSNGTLPPNLSWRKENGELGLAGQDQFSPSARYLVHGRRLNLKINGRDQHSLIQPQRMPDSEDLVTNHMGTRSKDSTRQTSKPILSSISRLRYGKTLRADPTTRNPQHGLQVGRVPETVHATPTDPATAQGRGLRRLPPIVCYKASMEEDVQQEMPRGMAEAPSTYLPALVQSATEIPTNSEANATHAITGPVYLLRESIYTAEWPPQGLQLLVSQDSGQKALPSLGPEADVFVYDLEVEDNHNFFADGVLVSNCDESGWIQNDKELYDACVYSLLTTNGRFISASTPGPRDTLFYLMCTDNETFGKFSRHHVGWRDAMEPNGPLKREALEAIREQMKNDQPRWQREMDAEFSETEDAFLSVGLISKCVDEKLEYFTEGVLLEGR